MRSRHLAAFLIVLSLLPDRGGAKGPYLEDFDGDGLNGWTSAAGQWKVSDGMVRQTDSDWGRYFLLSPVTLRSGTVSLRIRVDRSDRKTGGSFGLVLRYPGRKQYTILRLGAYGAIHLSQPVKDVGLGRFRPRKGRFYELKVVARGRALRFWVDGKLRGRARMSDSEGPGRLGFYTECRATLDRFEVRGNFRLDTALSKDAGPAELAPEFAEWVPITRDSSAAVSLRGGAHFYYRNNGPGDAVLDHVVIGTTRVDPARPPAWVAYLRQWPRRVRPVAVAQLELRLQGLPKDVGLRLIAGPRGAPASLPVTIAATRSKPLKMSVDLGRRAMFQINFFAFSRDLKKVFVYVQNNAPGAGARPVTIRTVELNGADVTARSRIGARRVGRDVVPIEIVLDKPLVKGRPVRVVVTTDRGLRTGHVLRAFPSKFNILVCSSQTARTDFLEDIHNHCATAINHVPGAADLRRFRFDVIPMASMRFLDIAIQFRSAPLAGVWVDEVDKPWGQPVTKLTSAYATAEKHMAGMGQEMPLQCFNLVDPAGSAASGHLTAPDTIMHSYGYFMCPATGRGFGRLDDLPYREYRMARRPFWSYFRDSEIPVPKNRRTKTMKPRHRAFQRCLMPKEQRWMTFGTLMQGAKSTAHWGYWAYATKGHYFIKGSALRLGLGGIAGNRVGPYVIQEPVVKMLKDVWDEIGRINAELQTIGAMVARSDVSHLARVVRVTPAKDKHGDSAAEVVALVAGLDTLVLNHNIDPGESPFQTGPISNPNPPKYGPVDVVAEVRLPAWIKPKHILAVDHERIIDAAPRRVGNRLQFRIAKLAVSRIYVITSSDSVRTACLERHADMRKRLAQMAVQKAVFDENWPDVDRP